MDADTAEPGGSDILKKRSALLHELCEECTHGLELGHCPEGTSHLQGMKDRLIAISNELLNNSDELKPGNHRNWSSVAPLSSTEMPSVWSTPQEREAFTPKLLDVNYIEGSGDRQWKSKDFPWTKKLEANNKKVLGKHSFRPNQREVINATMSGHDVMSGHNEWFRAGLPLLHLEQHLSFSTS